MKCLLAVDGSEGAKFAFRYICDNIILRGGEAAEDDHLFIVYVVEEVNALDFQYESMVYSGEWVAKANEELKERARKVLLAYGEDCKAKGLKYTAIMHVGSPREAIIKECKDHSVDLLAVGSRGMGLLKRILLGSVSSYLATHSPVPVLIVHPKNEDGEEEEKKEE